MSSSRRRALAALVLLPLAACGFHPLYADRSTIGYDPALAAITVPPAPDRVGQILVGALREELNPRGATLRPRYVLIVTLSVSRSDLGIRRDNTSSRGELDFTVNLRLNPSGSTDALYQDTVSTVTSFNIPDDAYAASIAEEKAREETADALGREVAERVAVFLRRQGKAGT